MKTVFDHSDYKAFLKSALPTEGPQRGARNRLADSLNCQKPFVSQVINGNGHFSLEHGVKICQFLKLDPQEEEYFLLLLHKGRAGSKDLEKFYDRRLFEIQERRREIKERIPAHTNDLSERDRMTYYSSWHYTAVHMCLMIPKLRTRPSISDFLGISMRATGHVLNFLVQVGLAKQSGDVFSAGPARIHLPKNSPLIGKHHSNWRIRAIDSLDETKERDLHYSMIMSISEDAAEKIREVLLEGIQSIEPVMKAANDDTAYALNIDLFGLQKTK